MLACLDRALGTPPSWLGGSCSEGRAEPVLVVLSSQHLAGAPGHGASSKTACRVARAVLPVSIQQRGPHPGS